MAEAVAALDERDARIKALEAGLRIATVNLECLLAAQGISESIITKACASFRNLLTNPTPAKAQEQSR